MIGAYAIAEVYKNISINCGDTIQESKIEKNAKFEFIKFKEEYS